MPLSSHDLNGDGNVEFSFGLDPNVTLEKETILGGNIDGDRWVPKNFDVTLVETHFDIVEGPLVTVYDETFALSGVGTQAVEFHI